MSHRPARRVFEQGCLGTSRRGLGPSAEAHGQSLSRAARPRYRVRHPGSRSDGAALRRAHRLRWRWHTRPGGWSARLTCARFLPPVGSPSVPVRTTRGDFDGDGATDIAVFRPSGGAWFVLNSSTNYTTGDRLSGGAPSSGYPCARRLRRRRQDRRRGLSPGRRCLVHPEVEHELHSTGSSMRGASPATSQCRAITTATAGPTWPCFAPRTAPGTS